MVKQYIKRHCKTREDKDALQEIVYRAQLTTLNLSYPHATKDRTEPCLAELVKGLIEDTRETGIGRTGSSAFSSEIVLMKGLYYGRKGKGYATEVVTTAEKLPPDGKETGNRR